MRLYTREEILGRIDAFRTISLCHLPTPLRKLENLSKALEGPDIYIKRDDLTGLAFGGNKSRKLEFIVGDMLEKKADTVLTWASLQSNWCMQTATAARMFGIQPILFLFKTYDLPPGPDGNLLLDVILGADIRFRDAPKGKVVKPEQVFAVMEAAAEDLRREGHRPYLVSVGGSLVRGDMDKPLGAISYVRAFSEMQDQALSQGIQVDAVVHSTGSGGTQAGLLVGARAITETCRVVGISVSDEREPFTKVVREIAQDTLDTLGIDASVDDEDIIVFDDYIRAGYGIVDREVSEVIRLVFQTEGIVLDPVYTSKAMVGLRDLVRKGVFKKGESVVFFHTGGTPALFPNRENILKSLESES